MFAFLDGLYLFYLNEGAHTGQTDPHHAFPASFTHRVNPERVLGLLILIEVLLHSLQVARRWSISHIHSPSYFAW